MADPGTNRAAPPEPRPTLEQSPESASGLSQPSPPRPAAPLESAEHFDGWETVSEQQDFYDIQDYLRPAHTLLCIKLKDRKEDDVVIFDYSLDPDYLSRVDRNSPVEGGDPSSGRFSSEDDIFFRVSKDRLIESKQFDQIISITKEPRLMHSRGPRLGIIDFPQCYDTGDDDLLNSMAEKLHLPSESAFSFKETHSKGVLALPGRGRFRTGISLRVPFKKLSELPKPGSSEDRFTFFVSVPYFGKSSSGIQLGTESESVRLLDFGRLGVDVPDRRGREDDEEIGDIREIFVHQARYMIFDNYTMATFRSKEDCARDQVPLHRSQERIGAFRAMIHMIANLMDSELWTLGKLQVSLCKLEEDIDQLIPDAKTYTGSQGVTLTGEEEGEWEMLSRGTWRNNIRREKGRIQVLLTSLSRFSVASFAAISVAERQIAILRDLHSVYWTGCRTETGDHQKRYPLRQNHFYRNISLIPMSSENPGQIWPNTLEIIDEVIRGRESFVEKIRELVENMNIRREILFGFLRFGDAKEAQSEKTAGEVTGSIKRIEDTIGNLRDALTREGQRLAGPTILNSMFIPLSFYTSYYGMSTIEEFNKHPLSEGDFWLRAGPDVAFLIIVSMTIAFWGRPMVKKPRDYLRKMFSGIWKKISPSPRKKMNDIENQPSPTPNIQEQGTYLEQAPNSSPDVLESPHPPGAGSCVLASGISTTPLQISAGQYPTSGLVGRGSGPPAIQHPQSPRETVSEPREKL